jgi:hypothetical protein
MLNPLSSKLQIHIKAKNWHQKLAPNWHRTPWQRLGRKPATASFIQMFPCGHIFLTSVI